MIVSDIVSFVQDCQVFIRPSPLRMSTYGTTASKFLEVREHVESLLLVCPTRWRVRTKAILALLNSYQLAIYDTLRSISRTGSTREIREKADIALQGNDYVYNVAINTFFVLEQL